MSNKNGKKLELSIKKYNIGYKEKYFVILGLYRNLFVAKLNVIPIGF